MLLLMAKPDIYLNATPGNPLECPVPPSECPDCPKHRRCQSVAEKVVKARIDPKVLAQRIQGEIEEERRNHPHIEDLDT